MEDNPIKDLQAWYSNQCNGSWESLYGITLETTDIPGWRIAIDLDETLVADKDMPEIIEGQEGDANYMYCRKTNSQFLATCAPGQLNKVITFFLEWATIKTK